MNASPWDATGPSQFGAHFYTPGWSPKPAKPATEPKPWLINQPKPLDFDAVKVYRSTHTMNQTAEHFGCTQRHLYRRYYDAVKLGERDPVDRMEVHAYRMSGKTIRACSQKFRISVQTVAKMLDGLPELPKPAKTAKGTRTRAPKLTVRYYIYITSEQRAKIAKHGKAAWVRALIDGAQA